VSLGIAGAFVGGFKWTIIVATIVTIILLAIYRAVVEGRRT